MFHDLADAIEEILPRIVAATGTPGVAVALATSTELRAMAAGHADLARRIPMSGTSVTPAGSLSKPLVGLSLIRLAEAGLIDVDGPIDPHLDPAARPANPAANAPITPGMLTAHLGGYRTDFIDAELTRPIPIAEYVQRRHEIGATPEYGGVCPLYGPPGQYAYSSFGMSLVGCAVENKAQRNYADFVHETILAPLGMTGSAVPNAEGDPWQALVASDEYAVGYQGFGPWCVPSPVYHSATYPGAGLITSPVDYARLLQSMLRASNGSAGEVVSPSGIAEMLKPRVARSSPVTPDSFAGIALEMSDPDRDGDLWWWGHSAAYPWGCWWDARIYPRLDLVVVAMANKWDMMRLHNPADRNAAGIVAQWAARWAASGPPPRRAYPVEAREWPTPTAETSAWIGAMVAERTYGTLGVAGRLDPQAIKNMVANTRPFDATDPPGLDGAAFERAVARLAELSPDPEAIRGYAAEQGPGAALWALECGATAAGLPLPAPVFSAPHK
ncbi:serine hydrolase domain-containing protein [Kibdelosporangium phytohabitans]|uniref:Penicillin-binding protein n=1 Tax=Kibdelosporangium phytohabitans TaxID=860235 RepID=A0A0N7F3E1_9PSEU|nr:serine hydrolase domain-containing protein [Kibdelosporangium phytohabitans]ALG08375.1 penicillin-binding protein [Kibdelosporangium phytohabitans]MBE1470578.1 CubicO group peptidase (beta-lactamase class C family) [Kibdelosporangium phytohabitans]